MSAWIQGKKRVGPWKVRWREVVDGKTVKRSSRRFDNIGEVEAEMEVVNARLAKAAALVPRRGTALLPMATVIERWKASGLTSGKITQYYAADVADTVTKLCAAQAWRHTALITASAVDAWCSMKPRGSAKPMSMLQTILRWARAVLRQPIDDAVLHLLPRRSPPRPAPPVLNPEHVALITARAYTKGEQYGAAIEHLALFGCRPADICRLNVGDWDPRTRMLTLQTTKSRTRPSHPIGGAFSAFAERLDRLTAQRPADAPLYLSPTGVRWRFDPRTGAARQLADWYRANITYQLQEIPIDRRCISALKDYAITNLDSAGVDDRTKTLFTGHRSLSVYARYKATNAERALDALAKLGAHLAPSGGRTGGRSDSRGRNRGQKTPRASPPSQPSRRKTRKKPPASPKLTQRHRA